MASSTMIPTITEVIQVSRRLVQVILRASERTSRANWARLVRFLGGEGRGRRAGHDRGGLGGAVADCLRAVARFPGHVGFLRTLTSRGCGRRAPILAYRVAGVEG